jgi:uncharacterized membrane protein
MNAPKDKQNPENWYWGVFYHNSADPDIWLPKRYGWGWTLNFAQPWSWIIMIGIIAATCLPYLFIS